MRPWRWWECWCGGRTEAMVAIGCGLVVLILAALALIQQDREQRACEHDGGHVEKFVNGTIMLPVSCGKNCITFVPTANIDWRCVRN